MSDVGDLPVLAFGNRLLKTGVITWPLKLHVVFLRFFSKCKKHDFLRFLSCCTRFLEHCRYGNSHTIRDHAVNYVNSTLHTPAVAKSNKALLTQGQDVTSAGWQVTLCDPMWYVSCRGPTLVHGSLVHVRTHAG